jgi:hypothetical protein
MKQSTTKLISIIFGVLILQLNFSCRSQYSLTELKDNFNEEQRQDLQKISDFFKNEMCLNMESDFRTCYERTPHEYLEAAGNNFWTNIDFEKQKELYGQISKSTFNEIWMFCETIYFPGEVKANSLCAVATGKYQRFLKDLGERNPGIAKYAERIKASGDFSGLNFNFREIFNDKKSFDLDDPNIQLIIAIHYLSLNDQETRNKTLMQPKRIRFD